MDVFDLFAKISLDTSEYDKGLNDASKKTNSFGSGLSNAFSGMQKVLSPAVKGFQAIEGVGQKAGDVMMKGVKGFMAASTAVAGFGGSAVKAGMSFDATMSQVSAISGATGEDFDALRNKAIEMGAKTQFSASEAAEALTYMGMAGWKTEDMLGGISGIMNLAAASGEDLAATSDIVTDALSGFGLTAKDSSHFADILAVASSNANTNVGMMGETFKYVAPAAGALGYSAEDTALAIGIMANTGIKASQAGTSLRSILTRLATDAGASSKSLGALGVLTEKLGVEFYNSDGSARAFNEVLMESREAWKGLTQEQQISYAKTIAGQEAMNGWMYLMNASSEEVDKLSDSINNCNGAAEKMANTMLDNLAGDMKLFNSALESLQITVSDALNPTLREFAQFGTKAMEQLTTGFQEGGVDGMFSALGDIVAQAVAFLAEKAPEFVAVSGKFIASLAEGILNSQQNIFQSANDIMVMLKDGLSSWLSSHGEELYDFGNRLLRLLFQGFLTAGDIISEHIGQFIPLLVNAFLSYHEALFTVGMDILGAIGRGLVENQDQIQSMASDTISSMVTAFVENAPSIIDGAIALLEALVNAIFENLPMITQAAIDIVAHLATGIGQALPELIPAAVEAIITFVETLTSPSNLSLLIDGALQLILGLVDGILKALPKLVAAAPVIITNLVTGLIANLPKIFEAAVEIIISLAEGLIQAIPELLKAIPQIIMALIDGIMAFVVNFVKAGADLIGALAEGIAGAWDGIVEFFSGAVNGLIDFLAQAWDIIKTGVSAAWEAIAGVFTAAWEAVEKVWGAVVEFFSGVWEGITGVFAGVAEFFSGIFSAAWEAIQAVWDFAVEYYSAIWEGIQAVFSAVVEVLGGFFSAAWDVVSGVWSAAVDFFSGIWDGIVGIFRGIAEWFGNLFSSAWEAITSAWSGVGEFFSGIWDTITSFFTNAWNVFSEIGGNIVKGLWSGIQNLAGWLWDKISGWVKSIWDGVLNFFDIHSPSGKFEWVAKMDVKGFAGGIAKYGHEAVKAMEAMSGDVMDAFSLSPNLSDLSPRTVDYAPNPPTGGPTAAAARPEGLTVIINSPQPVDAVQAAREWKKTSQQMAMGFI